MCHGPFRPIMPKQNLITSSSNKFFLHFYCFTKMIS